MNDLKTEILAFMQSVRSMREQQKNYFRHRNRTMLDKSIAAERNLDKRLMTLNNSNEFVSLVREMRLAQKQYFFNNNFNLLQIAVDLEIKVDKAIEVALPKSYELF